jgi:hypothetical protein
VRSPGRLSPANAPIPLDPSFLPTRGREETENALRRIVCSVKFELLERANAVRLLGPEMSYHHVDPYLSEALTKFEQGMTLADVLSYRSSTTHFDLSFEDSWTGYFIAARFRDPSRSDELVLIHLDDHTDMMATLLCRVGETLIDPTTGASFDPTSSSDWEAAIYSGAVNIGNFITPFYYSGTNVHVRHINNSTGPEELFHVSRVPCRYELIPDKQFAAIGKSSSSRPDNAGTYLVGSSPDRVLDGAPRAWTLIHIDLDYFINDFNGASRGDSYIPDPMLRTEARGKMNRFFDSLTKLNPTVDRWLVATSPGFCSACHWKWLLVELEARIEAFEAAQVSTGRS